ncbi:MAG: hypothetical protein FJ288_17170 [Planctomycetes bacterium]|nr:hypothetical protein [Planctomycetota bacterium]
MPARVKLSDILGDIEMPFEESHAFVDRETGQVVTLSDEELNAADDGDDPADYPEWQRENIRLAALVNVDDGSRFVPLPDRFEINEWEMMRDFALSVEDEDASAALTDAIHGRGAFRYFKDQVRQRGLAKTWNDFRAGRYRQIALDWCEANSLEVDTGA